MYSVTQRIKAIKQPYGGYIPSKLVTKTQLSDDIKLNENENIHPSLVGIAVDYLTRYYISNDVVESFRESILGGYAIGEEAKVKEFLTIITGDDKEKAAWAACKIAGYDVIMRSGIAGYKPVEEIEPNKETIENVINMVNRGLKFASLYGPITKCGFTFENGYTETVSSGDGDYLTKDTLWDFKVSKNNIESTHRLQLLMYYLMGKHSIHKEFETITKLGIFNPRLNMIYTINICDIDKSVIKEVETHVIGYK